MTAGSDPFHDPDAGMHGERSHSRAADPDSDKRDADERDHQQTGNEGQAANEGQAGDEGQAADEGASERDLRRAFHRRARKLHPDVNPSPDAEERFKDLVARYEEALARHRARRASARPRARPPRRASAGPRHDSPRSKLQCPSCGERYEEAPECFRCALPLWDGRGPRPELPTDPAVQALEARLAACREHDETGSELSPSTLLPSTLPPSTLPALLFVLAGSLTAFLFWVGLFEMAIVLLLYTTFIACAAAVDLHQQRTFARWAFVACFAGRPPQPAPATSRVLPP